jgi:hypothetical protein
MNHQDAVQLSLVEKYLLDELSPELRDEFEEHYFDCRECALDVRATAAFLDAAKEELKTLPVPKAAAAKVPTPAKKPGWAWFPEWLWSPALLAPVLAACLLVIAYQNLLVYPHSRSEVAQLQAPQVLPSIALAGGESRGAGELQSVSVRRGQPFSMLVDIPTQDRFSGYTCLLYSPSNSLLWRVAVSAQQAKDTVVLGVPASNWTPGVYTLVVQGNTGQAPASGGTDLEHQRFTLSSPE